MYGGVKFDRKLSKPWLFYVPKITFFAFPVGFFRNNVEDFSVEHGERFHQNI